MIRKQAFTLSEVLITLVVIGIIAAITVPVIMANHQKTQTVNLLKKAYSTISQTTALSIFRNGPIDSWEVDGDKASLFTSTYIKPFLNKTKDCGFKADGDCLYEFTPLNSNVKSSIGRNFDRFFLPDGQLILVRTPTNTKDGISSLVYIDINGQKKPNKLGKDLFIFIYWIYHPTNTKRIGKFMPYGGDWNKSTIAGTAYPYCCNREKTGELCAALIMKDNWQISKDYPW